MVSQFYPFEWLCFKFFQKNLKYISSEIYWNRIFIPKFFGLELESPYSDPICPKISPRFDSKQNIGIKWEKGSPSFMLHCMPQEKQITKSIWALVIHAASDKSETAKAFLLGICQL